MGYYCISNAIIEGYENRIFQVCNQQLCYFFSIQSYGRAYPTPRGALPNMWGKYKRKTLVGNKGVDRHVRPLPHAAWNAACFNHFLWRVEYALEGSQFWLILILPLVFIQFEVMKLLFHAYIFYWFFAATTKKSAVRFKRGQRKCSIASEVKSCRHEQCSWPAGFDLWCDWAFSLTSFEKTTL